MFSKFKKIISGKIFRKENRGYNFSPSKDWSMLVVMFLISNIVLISLVSLNYLKILNEENHVSEFEKIESVNKDNLNKTLENLEDKRVRYENLLENSPKTSDPAI